jgi:prepilin-type N-terminal cleavage/methylation domain-containing protein
MKHSHRRLGRTPRAFTLVELLLVMGIIVLLVSLLMPAVSAAIVAVRKAATQSTINQLGAALEAFKADWGIYPPSDNRHETNAKQYGWNNLGYYLMGPEAKGWGTNCKAGSYKNATPFGGSDTTTLAYPAYFVPDQAGAPTDRVLDAFKPGQWIFYFRFDPSVADSTHKTGRYDVTDNGPVDTKCITQFAGQEHFELLVMPKNPRGVRAYVREDYLLISCGADRFWGYVGEDSNGNIKAPTSWDSDFTNPPSTIVGGWMCDDNVNFKQ